MGGTIAISLFSIRWFRHRKLLVVIAIIAILAAILFPVFAQAKMPRSRQAPSSNVKQLGLAYHMYGNDNDDMAIKDTDWSASRPRTSRLPGRAG